MNMRASMVRRDGAAACLITLAAAAFLFAWPPSLRPGFAPPPLTPPAIAYCPARLTTGDHQEHYDEWNAVHSPALIALSAAIMLPPDKRGQADAVTPPLDAATRLLTLADAPPAERNDQIPMLTPPRPMTPLAPQRLASGIPIPGGGATGNQRPSSAPAAFRMNLIGDWQGRSVELAPMFALHEPAAPWSFTAVLYYDQAGRVQHALLESAELDLPLRDEVARRLYQCRVTPGGAPGEGRLTVYGPGRPQDAETANSKKMVGGS